MLITDSHQHFWKMAVIAGLLEKLRVPLEDVAAIVADFEPNDLKPWLDKLRIHQTVVVQVNATLANTYYFLELADRHSWIGGVVGWIDLTDPAIEKTLDRIKHPKLVGFRHQWHDEEDPAWNVRPEVVRGSSNWPSVGCATTYWSNRCHSQGRSGPGQPVSRPRSMFGRMLG
jgi:L-fucono-1,5-lactonase